MKPIKIDTNEWSGGIMLVHGPYGAGKTRLLGDMLREEAQHGKVLYANFKGEDGYSTLSACGLFDLGYQVVYDIEKWEDVAEFVQLARSEKPVAIGCDSLRYMYEQCIAKKTGGKRPARLGKSRDEENEWTFIHLNMINAMTEIRALCESGTTRYIVFACPSDFGEDKLREIETGVKATKPMIVPDLRGKFLTGCAGWFDWVGYLSFTERKEASNKTILDRRLIFAPSKSILTKQRVPRLIMDPIVIPEGFGGWSAMKRTINEHWVTE